MGGNLERQLIMAKEQENLLADAEREERVRQKAYQLLKEDGSPQGRAEEFWHRARQILDTEADTQGAIS
jgi:chorismate mutase